jgi:5-methylcytosine-specific restriction endonuclease McrA
MKTCTKCGETKPKTEFYKNCGAKDGLLTYCKSCAKSNRASRYAANKDKEKADGIAYYAANRDKARATAAAYRAANPEKCRAANSKSSKANPEIRRIANQNRRARKRENGGKLSKGLAAKLLKLQRGKCACCSEPLGEDYNLDHIMPLALGGTNTDDNIQLLRQKCNNQKHTKHPVDFMQSRGFLI